MKVMSDVNYKEVPILALTRGPLAKKSSRAFESKLNRWCLFKTGGWIRLEWQVPYISIVMTPYASPERLHYIAKLCGFFPRKRNFECCTLAILTLTSRWSRHFRVCRYRTGHIGLKVTVIFRFEKARNVPQFGLTTNIPPWLYWSNYEEEKVLVRGSLWNYWHSPSRMKTNDLFINFRFNYFKVVTVKVQSFFRPFQPGPEERNKLNSWKKLQHRPFTILNFHLSQNCRFLCAFS